VTAFDVIEVIDVISHCHSQLQGGRPFAGVEQLDLEAGPKRFHSGVVVTVADGAERGQQAWAGLKHIEKTLNLKAYADYRPVGSVPHPTMSGMGIWSYSYKA
jgi:hypothetical protein